MVGQKRLPTQAARAAAAKKAKASGVDDEGPKIDYNERRNVVVHKLDQAFVASTARVVACFPSILFLNSSTPPKNWMGRPARKFRVIPSVACS